MGMVVRTNTMSTNAYRQLGMNNTALAKSLEKLSSGYRINRAGDDASGLAISEKMKAQIKGLEQASSNAQDGISLVQTAEGALTEVHSMLNRMVELATKSANGTIQDDVDRDAIQSEVDQLNEEITRISRSTNFNGINMLDGSLSKTTGVTTGTTAAVKGAAAAALGASTEAVDRANTAEVLGHQEFALYNLENNSGGDTDIVINYQDATGAAQTLTITLADAGTLDGDTASWTAAIAGATDTGDAFASGAEGGSFSDLFSVTVSDNRLVINALSVDGADSTAALSQANVTITSIAVDAGITDDQGVADVDMGEATAFTIDGADAGTSLATLGTQTVTFSAATAIESGSTVTIGSKTFEFLKDGAAATGTNIGISLTGDETAADVAELIASNSQSINGGTGFDLTVSAGSLVVSNTVAQGMDSATTSMKSGALDVSKAVAFGTVDTAGTTDVTLADSVTNNMLVTIGEKTYQLTYDSDPVLTDGAVKVSLSRSDKAADIATKLTAAIGAGATADGEIVRLTEGTTVSTKGQGLSIQIGDTAAAFNRVYVDVEDMSSTGLGINTISVSSAADAATAIDTIKSAINKVSTNRGNLGALQNRLEYAINNLDATAENMDAANSRIRDTDMAKEMMNYTKMSILSQAAQAMLAQANQQPQNILQLLQ